jgi:hypothetical protein
MAQKLNTAVSEMERARTMWLDKFRACDGVGVGRKRRPSIIKKKMF